MVLGIVVVYMKGGPSIASVKKKVYTWTAPMKTLERFGCDGTLSSFTPLQILRGSISCSCLQGCLEDPLLSIRCFI